MEIKITIETIPKEKIYELTKEWMKQQENEKIEMTIKEWDDWEIIIEKSE